MWRKKKYYYFASPKIANCNNLRVHWAVCKINFHIAPTHLLKTSEDRKEMLEKKFKKLIVYCCDFIKWFNKACFYNWTGLNAVFGSSNNARLSPFEMFWRRLFIVCDLHFPRGNKKIKTKLFFTYVTLLVIAFISGKFYFLKSR